MKTHAKMSRAMRSIVVAISVCESVWTDVARARANCGLLLFVLLFVPALWAQSAPIAEANSLSSAHALFKQGKFHEAAAAYRTLIQKTPSAEAYSGLIQSLLKLDDVKAADESARQGLAAFPDSAATHAARGDVEFRQGLIPEAETEYKTALKLSNQNARAWLGQGKVDAVFARRTEAKAAIAKAHELDPDDGDALYEWALRQPYPENASALEKHMAEFRNDDETERHEREYIEFIKALAGRKVWVPAREVERTEIKLELLTLGAGMAHRGYGVRVRLNDRTTVTLLLDTGSSGVIITRKLAEKIGARKLSEQSLEGVGKSGGSIGYKAWVDKVVIGDLEFHDCFVHATPREIAQVDGTIGTDVFEKYLVTVDFPGRKLRLEPLPAASSGQGSLTQAFNFGHFLLLPTEVGKRGSGLFVLDSGANANTITPELAKSLPEMRLINTPVSGASGVVNGAFMADDATLRFAGVRKTGERISTVDLRSVSKDLGVEISGQIGFSTIEEMKLLINYRDGMVGLLGKGR
jgi:tetratricopeptide (TPR) repeat protein